MKFLFKASWATSFQHSVNIHCQVLLVWLALLGLFGSNQVLGQVCGPGGLSSLPVDRGEVVPATISRPVHGQR